MGYFSNALVFLISTAFGLYILAVMLRFLFQLFRADFRNPFSQFLLTITTPVLRPLRQIIPGIMGIDWPAVVLLLLLKMAELFIVGVLQGAVLPIGNMIIIAIASLLQTAVYIIIFALIIRAVLSWVAPGTYNYMVGLLNSITEPLLSPIRRRMPATGDMDFSLLVLLVLLQLVLMLLVRPLMDMGLGRLI